MDRPVTAPLAAIFSGFSLVFLAWNLALLAPLG